MGIKTPLCIKCPLPSRVKFLSWQKNYPVDYNPKRQCFRRARFRQSHHLACLFFPPFYRDSIQAHMFHLKLLEVTILLRITVKNVSILLIYFDFSVDLTYEPKLLSCSSEMEIILFLYYINTLLYL